MKKTLLLFLSLIFLHSLESQANESILFAFQNTIYTASQKLLSIKKITNKSFSSCTNVTANSFTSFDQKTGRFLLCDTTGEKELLVDPKAKIGYITENFFISIHAIYEKNIGFTTIITERTNLHSHEVSIPLFISSCIEYNGFIYFAGGDSKNSLIQIYRYDVTNNKLSLLFEDVKKGDFPILASDSKGLFFYRSNREIIKTNLVITRLINEKANVEYLNHKGICFFGNPVYVKNETYIPLFFNNSTILVNTQSNLKIVLPTGSYYQLSNGPHTTFIIGYNFYIDQSHFYLLAIDQKTLQVYTYPLN